MSQQYPNAFAQKFASDVTIQYQQNGPRLKGKVMERSMVGGETMWLPQISSVDSVNEYERHGETQYNDTPHTTRKLTTNPERQSDLIDVPDMKRSVAQFMGPYATNFAYLFGRRYDRTAIDAARGTNYYKLNGATTETSIALPSTQKVAVNFGGSNVGLTLAKLIEAKSILGKNEVPMGELKYWVHRQEQLDDLLLNVDQTVNSDYAAVKALVNGEINRFMGFEFVQTQQVPVDASDYAYNIAYTKSALVMGITEGFNTRVEQLPTKNYSWQVWASQDIGGTRTQEEGVVEVACDQSP